MTALDDLTRDYRVAFLRYLSRRDETVLTSGYELGRTAMRSGVSLLDLIRIHHEVLLDVLAQSRGEDAVRTASAASELLLEVVATYDMTQRGVLGGG